MLLVKDGHLSELTELFERYHVKLYNFFLKLTFDTNTSEDLTQNLFYRIIKYRQSFEPGNGTFRSWIYRMARNMHADFCKQEQKANSRRKNVEDLEEGPPADGEGYTEDHYERLDQALARLQPDQREILVLSRYQGLKYEEISKIKEISVAAIKVQVHRAIKHLRSLYFQTS
jgi:RNA polymerase sigma-70 factor (ECF subfamily)